MKSFPMSLRSAVVVLVALAARSSHAASCASLGISAPDVVTFMASKTNPAEEGWLVPPTCAVQSIGVDRSFGHPKLEPSKFEADNGLERIVSMPTGVIELNIAGQSSLKSIDISKSNVKFIFILTSAGARLDMLLPKGLESLEFLEGKLESLDNIEFPAGMTRLEVKVNDGLRSLRNAKLPAALKILRIQQTKLASVDFSIPSRVEVIDLDDNPISTLDGLVLPTSATTFNCYRCGLTSVQGVRWPPSIQNVNLDGNALTMFEIRQSDVRTVEALTSFKATVSQTSCKQPKAVSKTIRGVPVCIIDDDEFESSYGSMPAPTKSSSGRDSDNDKGLDGVDAAVAAATNDTTSISDESSSTDISDKFRLPKKEDTNSMATTSGPTISAALMVVIGAVGSLVAVLLAVIVYRVFFVKRRSREPNSETKYARSRTPTAKTIDPDLQIDSTDSSEVVDSSSNEYLTNDVRNDKNLLPYRIERGEVQLGKVIARGGFGMVYRGKYDGRDVAIKQMLPDAWRDDTMLASFMDEIRLCASLDHPKIVQFVGITWSSLRDLSVLTEFMAGGDLYDLLYQPANGPRAEHWSQPWSTMTVSNLKCKTQMALDVAEAVVYLHSFASPIIHRDLKSKNVLLDGRGNPKLSDFGISREMVVDETMTSMIGTSAWIAPEVLRGERYSEKADIYSFGVLLVELDRCCHPYEGEPMLEIPQRWMQGVRRGATGGSTGESIVSRSAQIALLVSTGQLRPSLSPDAPPLIKTLASRCLVNDPEDRLTSMEVCFELRQIARGTRKQKAGRIGVV